MANTNSYVQRSYSQQQGSSDIFYETEIKKDSEIHLRDSEMQQYLLSQESGQRNQQRDNHRHQQQSLEQQQKQQRQQPSESEPTESLQLSPDNSAPVSSTTGSIDLNLSGSLDLSSSPGRQCPSERAHVCSICFKGFRNKPQLTQHELVHNNVRKHVCSYCEKSFKQISHLNQHIRVHTGERPYKCDVEGCGRSFAQLSNLNHHKKNHEEHVRRDVSRQFRCAVCDRSYATRHSLNTHIQKLHSNLKAVEGSVEHPILTTTTTSPRKRKKADQPNQESEDIQDSLVMECDNDNFDDDLPTQVKVKPRFGSKVGLTVRIGTPPGDREKNRQAQRTSLPLPFTSGQSQLTFQNQAEDSFMNELTNSLTSRGHGEGQITQPNSSQNIFSVPDSSSSLHNGNVNLHGRSQSLHAPVSNLEQGARLAEERELIEAMKHKESVMVKQQELMQMVTSDRTLLSRSNLARTTTELPSSSVSSQMVFEQARIRSSHAPPEDLSLYSKTSQQISQSSFRSDNPTHIAHHYPKTNTSDHNPRGSSQQIFNPAFSDRGQTGRSDR